MQGENSQGYCRYFKKFQRRQGGNTPVECAPAFVQSFLHARPVYLSRDERIKAHFMTCFLALVLFRYLEKKLENRFTCEEILGTLGNMNFLETSAGDYIPTYTRTDLTDALHEAFGFRTDYQIIERKNMKGIFKITKKIGSSY